MARGWVSGETIVCEWGASRFRTGWRVVGGEHRVVGRGWVWSVFLYAPRYAPEYFATRGVALINKLAAAREAIPHITAR